MNMDILFHVKLQSFLYLFAEYRKKNIDAYS